MIEARILSAPVSEQLMSIKRANIHRAKERFEISDMRRRSIHLPGEALLHRKGLEIITQLSTLNSQ